MEIMKSELVNNYTTPDLMYKLGMTKDVDAAKRFTVETAAKKRFRKIALGKDYNATVMWSRWMPYVMARKLEISFENMIKDGKIINPKYNGITECRLMDPTQVNELLTKLRKRFPIDKYGIENKGKANYYKVYFTKLDKKVKYDTED